MGNTMPSKKKPPLTQAERDFGPCGKLLNAMDMNAMAKGDEPPNFDLLYGVETCLKQHLERNTYDKEQRLKMETLVLVFGDPGPNTPPDMAREILAAREKAGTVDWVKKMKD